MEEETRQEVASRSGAVQCGAVRCMGAVQCRSGVEWSGVEWELRAKIEYYKLKWLRSGGLKGATWPTFEPASLSTPCICRWWHGAQSQSRSIVAQGATSPASAVKPCRASGADMAGTVWQSRAVCLV